MTLSSIGSSTHTVYADVDTVDYEYRKFLQDLVQADKAGVLIVKQ